MSNGDEMLMGVMKLFLYFDSVSALDIRVVVKYIFFYYVYISFPIGGLPRDLKYINGVWR